MRARPNPTQRTEPQVKAVCCTPLDTAHSDEGCRQVFLFVMQVSKARKGQAQNATALILGLSESMTAQDFD
ncbi:hypothetical protein L1887_47638 [Cichorium endivia]|nr:hypothetical protein L1887_47638 [Cichorium endivia]